MLRDHVNWKGARYPGQLGGVKVTIKVTRMGGLDATAGGASSLASAALACMSSLATTPCATHWVARKGGTAGDGARLGSICPFDLTQYVPKCGEFTLALGK